MARLDLKISKERIRQFCQQYGIKRLAFFGSVLRDDFSDKSDVDILVVFKPGASPGFIKLARMEREFSKFFGDRKVDLNTPASISRFFRDDVINEAEEIYVET